MFTLKDRTCVFSGATGEIGRGAVRALAEGGMNVAMVTHFPKDADDIVEQLKNAPGACIAMDNKNGDSSVYGDVIEKFNSLDVLIINSGSLDAVKPLEDVTREELSSKLNHQITHALDMVIKAIPYLEKSKAGRIILVASAGAQDGFQGENFCDSVARGGVISMTYCLARELISKGITVNCIARSGVINDHAPRRSTDYNSETIKNIIPAGYLGTSDEFGAAVAYLASEEAGFVTGQIINLSGGLHIG